MRAMLGPRFGVEATFIIAVAAVAGLLELPLPAIVAAIFAAWGVVALAEVVASRRAASRPPVEDVTVEPAPPAPLSAPAESWPTAPEPLTVEVEFEPEVTVAEAEAEAEAAASERQPVASEPEPEPEPVVASERPRLTAVPAPSGASGDEPGPAPVAEEPVEPAVVPLRPSAPREWNVWDLERRLQAATAGPTAGGELSYLLLYLREYANPDGVLPVEFDALVRESFGDLVEAES